MHFRTWGIRVLVALSVVLVWGGRGWGQEVPVKLVAGHTVATGHAKFYVAKEQGFFAREGLEVELVPFLNSGDGIAALRAGKVHTGAFGTNAPLVHIARGADFRIIAGIMGGDSYGIATPETAAKIKSLHDLRGKRVGTIRLSSGDVVFRASLHNAGLSYENDLTLVDLKSAAAVVEAVKSGNVEVGVIWGPHDQKAVAEGLAIVFHSDDPELIPGHPCCRLIVTGEEYARRPEVWRRFIRALLQADRFAHTEGNREQTVDAIVGYVPLDKELIEKAFYHNHLDQSSDPNTEGVRAMWEVLVAAGYIETDIDDISRFVEAGLYRDALASLIAEEPDDPYWKQLQAVFDQRNGGAKGGGR